MKDALMAISLQEKLSSTKRRPSRQSLGGFDFLFIPPSLGISLWFFTSLGSDQ
jgi:hypothetical protein